MVDQFASSASGLDSPAPRAIPITPNDTADLILSTRGIYVGVGGDVTVVTVGGDVVTFVGYPQGGIIPVRAARVMATGTLARSLVGMS